jgi:hypothetical protein
MSTGKHLASILVLTLFIITTTIIEEKFIQQHGKGYIVPSKYNYRLDKIGCYMHTRPKSTRAKLCFSIKKQQYLLYICYILLLQASDIELNPGPNTTTFPCNICGNKVNWNQKAVACDNCSDWHHTSCMHINSYHYNVLQKSNISWICKNFSSSIFEAAEVTTSNSFQDISNEDLLMNDTSANSDTSEFPLHCSLPLKSALIKKLDNKLRSVCLNIQSIKGKREALWNILDSSTQTFYLVAKPGYT